MKRTIITSTAIFLFGLLVGASALYFLAGRAQTQMLQQVYAMSLTDRVLIAARLRAGMEQKILEESELMIGQGVAGVSKLADGMTPAQHALRMAKAYYDYNAIPIPVTAQPILASVEAESKKSFEAMRDMNSSARE